VLKRMLTITCITAVSIAWAIPASGKKLSPKAENLVAALAQLQNTPDDSQAQQRYLAAFPNTYTDFLDLFGFNHELYDGHEYIEVLSRLAKNNEMTVGRLLVALSKDAHYEADATSSLQQATAIYAADHTRHFLDLLQQLSEPEQRNLITFLADVENHAVYVEYQAIIDHAKSLGDASFVERLEQARTERSRQPH